MPVLVFGVVCLLFLLKAITDKASVLMYAAPVVQWVLLLARLMSKSILPAQLVGAVAINIVVGFLCWCATFYVGVTTGVTSFSF